MKIQFTRTPPKEYSAYVEGETADLDEKEARYLVGLGVAAVPRGIEGATTSVSSRTEIIGDGPDVAAVVTGRGANIVAVSDPKPLPDTLTVDANAPTADDRRAARSEEAMNLVKQEASRTGGFVDNTEAGKRAGKKSADRSLDRQSDATAEAEAEAEKAQEAARKKAADERKAAEAAKKASGAAPENK